MKPSYEELEAKCAALAAENAGLKSACERVSMWNDFPHVTLRSTGEVVPYAVAYGSNGERDYMRNIAATAVLKDTPATDAFLAEVRASGMPDESTDRNLFEEWVMENVCISKSTLEGLRTDVGYRNSTLSGRDYNVMWLQWKAVRAGQLSKGVQS